MLDIIIIAIIIGTAFIAARVGFIKTIYQLCSSLLALVLAFFVYPIVEYILKLTPLYDWVVEGIKGIIPELVPTQLQSQGLFIQETLKGMPDFITEQMIKNNNPEVYQLLGVNNLVDYIAAYVANLCIMGIAIIVCFLVIRVVLAVGVNVLDLIAKLPILKTANKWAGFGVGLIKGVLIVWIIFLVVPLLLVIPSFSELQNLMDQSLLTPFFYNNNFVLEILSSVMF